jgi:hypothetical protein
MGPVGFGDALENGEAVFSIFFVVQEPLQGK